MTQKLKTRLLVEEKGFQDEFPGPPKGGSGGGGTSHRDVAESDGGGWVCPYNRGVSGSQRKKNKKTLDRRAEPFTAKGKTVCFKREGASRKRESNPRLPKKLDYIIEKFQSAGSKLATAIVGLRRAALERFSSSAQERQGKWGVPRRLGIKTL